MDWRIFAAIAPFLFVSYQALSKLLPKNISVLLVNAYVSAIGALLMLLIYLFTSSNKSITLNTKYIPVTIGIAVLISFGNFAIIKAYSLGAPQSSFVALFNPLYIIYGVLFGLFIWHEKLNLYQVLGVFLSFVGMFLIIYFKK